MAGEDEVLEENPEGQGGQTADAEQETDGSEGSQDAGEGQGAEGENDDAPNEDGKGFDFLAATKLLLGISDEKSDALVGLFLDATRRSILNYCNLREFPEELNYTLCQMAADAFREGAAKSSAGGIVGNVSSVSEDGRSVSFGGVSDIQARADDRVSRTRELDRYKKLYRL